MTTGNVSARSMTREEARRLTDEIKADTEAFLEKIAPKLARAYAEQAWYALDYETLGQVLPGGVRVDTAATRGPHRCGAVPARRGGDRAAAARTGVTLYLTGPRHFAH